MSTIKAVVRNGRIETDEPLDLPDGTELVIPLPASSVDEKDIWDDSPEGIAAWLTWADSLEPLIFNDSERAAWEAERRARKNWEQAHFDEHAANLRKVWE